MYVKIDGWDGEKSQGRGKYNKNKNNEQRETKISAEQVNKRGERG
jgi:hypothetical protein